MFTLNVIICAYLHYYRRPKPHQCWHSRRRVLIESRGKALPGLANEVMKCQSFLALPATAYHVGILTAGNESGPNKMAVTYTWRIHTVHVVIVRLYIVINIKSIGPPGRFFESFF